MSNCKKTCDTNKKDIVFQVSDWDYYHEHTETDAENSTETDSPEAEETAGKPKKFVIRMYGTTDDNKKIFVKVNDFTPYFYVGIPEYITQKRKVDSFIDTIKKQVKFKNPEMENSLKSYSIVKRKIFWEFTDYKDFQFIRLVFHSYEGFRAYEREFNKPIFCSAFNSMPVKYKLYESNIEPMLRCMHHRNINSVGWIKIKSGKYERFTEENNPSNNEIGISVNWLNLDRVDDNTIVPLIVAAFDIECMSEDGSFPQAKRDGDKIIQISTTYNRYGENECFRKHIITLDTCDNVDGVEVESYKTEREVLLAWTRLIQKSNPDIITGYNIFGFDFKYMVDRAKKLGCYQQFAKLGRIKNEESLFVDKVLASSALGENKLQYFAMQGRVVIDIMKVVQRDYKLGSYKLDNVASDFIREKIKKVDDIGNSKNVIITKGTYGLDVGRYVKINFNDGLSDNSYKNEAKFRVLQIIPKYFCEDVEIKNKMQTVYYDGIVIDGVLDGEALELRKYVVSWCQAKDDVTPNDIFEMQKKTSKDRAVIASYCVQDSNLCNKLMNKLQILTNNIGMANVCHVPLSYIFLRGQGIKIFSLVAKKCRERNHVIPVIKKPYKPTPEDLKKFPNKYKDYVDVPEEDGYEGATVFEPTVGVHFEPITVLDYNSLYPNSMIFRNISHECIVKNSKYLNMPNYDYEDVTYSNKDGTETTCVYAKPKDGTKGILPEILTELLDARARMRGLAEKEPDAFKAKILDSLQLAYKVTANSLYGQTGASTSPLCMKDIAASTTATGREMLNCARILTEVIFPILVNTILHGEKEDYEKKINMLFSKEIDELIGQKNVNMLKKKQNGEEIERYSYLRIFKNNRGDINKKFINAKLNHTCKQDFIEWFYNEVSHTMKGKTLSPNIVHENNANDEMETYGKSIDPDVIYGDSVTKDTPIIMKKDNKIIVLKIEDIGNNWKEYAQFKSDDVTIKDKEQDDCVQYEVWTDKGWSKIKRVIRHHTQKEIFRVFTDVGIVDVTSEHSLLNDKGEIIKPNECVIGQTKLLYNIPDVTNNEGETKNKQNDYVYDKDSIIPFDIINEPIEVRNEFLQNYHLENGNQQQNSSNGKEYYEVNAKGKTNALTLYCLVTSLGYNVSIGMNDDMGYIYKITYYKRENWGDVKNESNNVIKQMLSLGTTNDYVYDLETEAGHFHAGVGSLIVKNTDSIFIKFNICNEGEADTLKNEEALKISIKLGILVSSLLHKILPVPQNAAYEKTLFPLILLSKKRYVGNKYEFDINEFHQLCMGIVLKRRDNAPIVKIIIGGIVNSILNDKSPEKAVEFTKKTLHNVLSGKYPLEKFIITKTLKGNSLTADERRRESLKPKDQRSYADRTRIVHAVLADRMADRDPGNKPASNDRIPYAYVVTEKEVELQGDRVEHPEYIINNNLKLDYLFYITNQIMKPAIQFLEHVVKNPEKIFETCIMKELNRRNGKRPLSYYFNLVEALAKQEDAFGEVEDDDETEYADVDILNSAFNCYHDDVNENGQIIKKNILRRKQVKKISKTTKTAKKVKKVKNIDVSMKPNVNTYGFINEPNELNISNDNNVSKPAKVKRTNVSKKTVTNSYAFIDEQSESNTSDDNNISKSAKNIKTVKNRKTVKKINITKKTYDSKSNGFILDI